MRTLYLGGAVAARLAPRCCVVAVSPLLRELVSSATRLEPGAKTDGRLQRLIDVACDEIVHAQDVPLKLPAVWDPRLRKIEVALERDPSNQQTLAQWGREVGAASRTLARLFRKEAGMTFGEWRQQFRLLRALEYLAAGKSVTEVALSVGYESSSAFIVMFRKALGTTPNSYFLPR